MSPQHKKVSPRPAADGGAKAAQRVVESPQTRSASYKLAYQDPDFLLRDELRPVRLQLELVKLQEWIKKQGWEFQAWWPTRYWNS